MIVLERESNERASERTLICVLEMTWVCRKRRIEELGSVVRFGAA